MRLHVHHRDPVEAGELVGGDDLDLDVEQVLHPQVFRARGALQGANDGRLLGSPQDVAERQAARHRIRIGVVVQENQYAVGIAEESLVLLDPKPRQRSAELDQQRLPEQLGERKIVHLGEERAQLIFMLVRVAAADADDIHERGARVANRFQYLAKASLSAVFDDDAGGGGDVGLEIGVGSARVAGEDVQVGVMQPAGERLALDEKFDFEAGHQGFVEHPDDQLGLADGKTPHSI